MVADYEIKVGDCLTVMADIDDESWACCVTSPPYYNLRDYDSGEGEIGCEKTVAAYVEQIVKVCAEVRRILTPDGTLWLNLGDSFAGAGPTGTPSAAFRPAGDTPERERVRVARTPIEPAFKPKDLMMIPARVAIALQADGWWLRNEIVWAKPNPVPSPVKDRCVCSTERIYLLAKSHRYHFDYKAIRDPATYAKWPTFSQATADARISRNGPDQTTPIEANGWRNKRDCWRVPTASFDGAHFAVFPPKLIEPCVLAGCPVGGVVGDPFMGSGTTGVVAIHHDRNFCGIELNADYATMAEERIKNAAEIMAENERQTTLNDDRWAA